MRQLCPVPICKNPHGNTTCPATHRPRGADVVLLGHYFRVFTSAVDGDTKITGYEVSDACEGGSHGVY
jgi:hypothetical protein